MSSRLFEFIRDSKYGMPMIQSEHLMAITVLLATLFALNLRLVGLAMTAWPAAWFERQLRPWALGAGAFVLASGALIFLGSPGKYLSSNPFRLKMALLTVAVTVQVVVVRRVVASDVEARPLGTR